ncbi:MAG: LysR family transcriptional regulator [Coriobacteriaceae bacterium]|nr:LysR family transcriptional regulator [Coriobacteriaceae bacterium]
MDKKQLDYFLEVCRSGNLTTASEALFLTRQALSKSIRMLEHEVGAPFFIRTSLGLRLTREGEIFKEYAEGDRAAREAALRKIHGTEQTCQVVIGAHLSHRTDADIEFLLAFQSTEENVKVVLQDVEEHNDSWDMLKDGRLDVVFSRTKPKDATLAWVQAGETKVLVLLGKDHPLAFKDALDFSQDLRGETYYSMSHDTLAELEGYCKAFGIKPEYVTPNRNLLRKLLGLCNGVFVVPEISAEPFLREGLVALPLRSYPLETGVFFVYRRDTAPLVKRYIEYLRTYPLPQAPPLA